MSELGGIQFFDTSGAAKDRVAAGIGESVNAGVDNVSKALNQGIQEIKGQGQQHKIEVQKNKPPEAQKAPKSPTQGRQVDEVRE